MSRSIRVLVVDDHTSCRHLLRLIIQRRHQVQVIGEACDGIEAIRSSQELQPDLILLDVGLPDLSGIAVARRIREVAPSSRILFVSENRSRDIVAEAFHSGGDGYVVKSAAGSDLLPAVESVLQGRPFVSASLSKDVS